MTLATLEKARQEDDPEVVTGGGLDFGINSYHLRMLCESGWNGGGGYTPEQVGDMTPDQIYFRLCEIDLLKRNKEGRRVRKVPVYSRKR
jgi:hypothetical protein